MSRPPTSAITTLAPLAFAASLLLNSVFAYAQPASPAVASTAPSALAPPAEPSGLTGAALTSDTAPTTVSAATRSFLEKLEAINKDRKTVHATFNQEFIEAVFQEVESSPGELWFEKPARLRIDSEKPHKMITLVTGNTFYNYEARLKSVNYLKFESDAERDARLYNYLVAFGFKTSELVERFSVVTSLDTPALQKQLADEKADAGKVTLLHIRPQAAYAEESPFTQLKIWIDKTTLLPQKIWYTAGGSSEVSLTMKKIEFNQTFDPTRFDATSNDVIPQNIKPINLRNAAPQKAPQ